MIDGAVQVDVYQGACASATMGQLDQRHTKRPR